MPYTHSCKVLFVFKYFILTVLTMELNLIYISGSSCQISFSISLIPRGFFLTFKSVVVYLPYTKNAHADRVNMHSELCSAGDFT